MGQYKRVRKKKMAERKREKERKERKNTKIRNRTFPNTCEQKAVLLTLNMGRFQYKDIPFLKYF